MGKKKGGPWSARTVEPAEYPRRWGEDTLARLVPPSHAAPPLRWGREGHGGYWKWKRDRPPMVEEVSLPLHEHYLSR